MPSENEVIELLYWQQVIAHAKHLLGGHQEALAAGEETLRDLQDKLLEAVMGGHIKGARERGVKISPSDFSGNTQRKEKLYYFFECILSATGNTLSILQQAVTLLQKMMGEREMSLEERAEGLKLFSAIEDALNKVLCGKAEGGRR